MTFDPVPTDDIRLVSAHGLRGLLLFFLIAIAAAEVGMAVSVGEAWRSAVQGRPSQVSEVIGAVDRLATLQSVFVLGAAAALTMWLLIALINTARATPRHSIENRMSMRGLILSALLMIVALILRDRQVLAEDVSETIAICAVMWAPFALINGAALRLATSQIAIRWWYGMLCATLVIHQYFTSRFDLAEPFDPTRAGRTALLHASSALLMGLASLFAADSTGCIRDGLADRAARHRYMVLDARSRTRRSAGPDLAGSV